MMKSELLSEMGPVLLGMKRKAPVDQQTVRPTRYPRSGQVCTAEPCSDCWDQVLQHCAARASLLRQVQPGYNVDELRVFHDGAGYSAACVMRAASAERDSSRL